MNLYQIARQNLKRRWGKMAFMLVALSLVSAVVVSIFNIIITMQADIGAQLAEMGANIVVTPDRGELSFQYGGITIPELVFDATTLTENDLDKIMAVADSETILALAPRLIGSIEYETHHLVINGTDLPAEFAVKPWLRFQGDRAEKKSKVIPNTADEPKNETMAMDYQALNLARVLDVPELHDSAIVPGSATAEMLGLINGDTIELSGRQYVVLDILEPTGMAEDNQIFMNLNIAQDLLNKPGELTVIELTADFNRVDEETLITQLSKALPHANISGVRQAVMGRNELLISFYRFGLVIGGMIGLSGLLIVMFTMSAAVRERTREIGVFRAIGFRGKDIFLIITTEAFLISFISGLSGYHAGLLLSRLTAPMLTGASMIVSWHPAMLAITMSATILAGILAALPATLKATRLEPAEALRFI